MSFFAYADEEIKTTKEFKKDLLKFNEDKGGLLVAVKNNHAVMLITQDMIKSSDDWKRLEEKYGEILFFTDIQKDIYNNTDCYDSLIEEINLLFKLATIKLVA